MNKNWSKAVVDALFRTVPENLRPRIAIETGTYRGRSAANLSPLFLTWHTIDIQPKYTEIAKERCKHRTNVVFHVGDSRKVLPEILAKYPVTIPLCIFLDAHFTRTNPDPTVDSPLMQHHPDGADFPLYAELDAIAKRGARDIVVIDDWGLAGTEPTGCRADGDVVDQWSSLSIEAVMRRLSGRTMAMPLEGTMAFYCNL